MKYTIISALLWMNWIQLSGSIDGCTFDPTGIICNTVRDAIPDIFNDVQSILNEKIPDILDDVEEIFDEIPNIVDMVNKIPGMVEILELLIKNPLKVTDDLGNDINELAEKLETCIGQVIDLIDPMKPIYDLLLKNIPEIDIDFIPDLPDINDLVYKTAAVVLLPFKSAVKLTCDEVLPEAISAVTSGLNGMSLQRRRSMKSEESIPTEDSVCEELNETPPHCPSQTFTWAHDDNGMYRNMVINHPGLIDEDNLPGGSNANVYQRIRISKFTFDMIITILEWICEIPEKTVPNEVENVDSTKKAWEIAKKIRKNTGNLLFFGCKGLKGVLEFINHIFDYAIGSADLHDGEVQFTMISAIFNDRIAIIHNQREILRAIHESSLGTINGVENSELIETHALDAIKDAIIDKISNLEIYPAKAEFSTNVDKALENDETGLITITLKMRDFVFVAISIACCLFFFVIGIVIGNCCSYRYKSPGGFASFAAVPKYDYTTSDIDDSSK